jgi:pimeloyl-ACP methyl ester carboxylesterase
MTGPMHWTAREEERAGKVRTELESVFGDPPESTNHLIIWIHGFNTAQIDAERTWKKTHMRVRDITSLPRLRDTVWFFWPGDASRNKHLSAISYFSQVPKAVRAGHLLAKHVMKLSAQNSELEVSFVAHSLGCRVALEAARELSRVEGGSPVRDLLLFAAAVPEGLCLTGHRYEERLAKQERVLFSTSDSILKRWFPLGQVVARGRGYDLHPGDLKKAVGFTGGPSSRWSWRREAAGYEHDDYWTENESLNLLGSLYGHVQKSRNPATRLTKERQVARRIAKEN